MREHLRTPKTSVALVKKSSGALKKTKVLELQKNICESFKVLVCLFAFEFLAALVELNLISLLVLGYALDNKTIHVQ